MRIRRHRDLDADEMAEVIARADAWRDTETERGFSMALGRLGDPADGDCLLVEAVQGRRQATVVAMLSLVPWGTNGVSLDLMRRSPQSPNGTIELMVSELCMQSEGIGITPYFAELRDVPLGIRAGRPTRRRARSRGCGVRCWCSSPAGGSWRRCTGRT